MPGRSKASARSARPSLNKEPACVMKNLVVPLPNGIQAPVTLAPGVRGFLMCIRCRWEGAPQRDERSARRSPPRSMRSDAHRH